jgi:hypothetical protein
MSALLTLERIWKTGDKEINEILLKSDLPIEVIPLLNKINLAKAYLKTNYLSVEDQLLVENPEFKDYMLTYPLEIAIVKLQRSTFGLLSQIS